MEGKGKQQSKASERARRDERGLVWMQVVRRGQAERRQSGRNGKGLGGGGSVGSPSSGSRKEQKSARGGLSTADLEVPGRSELVPVQPLRPAVHELVQVVEVVLAPAAARVGSRRGRALFANKQSRG